MEVLPWDESDGSKTTFFVIVGSHTWINTLVDPPKTILYWDAHVILDQDAQVGHRYCYEEANFASGGDSYDNVYVRVC